MSTAIAASKGRWQAFVQALELAQPRVLYGVRMICSVTLAMSISFWLQLDNAFWAPLSAAIVCQPTIGASLRKGQFRLVGTCTGALGIVVLTALMPQSRIGLVAGLVAWGMAAGIMTTILRNAAAYAAALAGYTAAIVFSDAVNNGPGAVFIMAVTRATEISIGVFSAGLVLSATDTGNARIRLAGAFASLLSGIAEGLADTLRDASAEMVARRRALIGQFAALEPLEDEALGETADLRYRSGMLSAGTQGMLRALAAWNDVSMHLSAAENRPGGAWVMPLDGLQERIDDLDWKNDPAAARRRCRTVARVLLARSATTISERLLLDRVADALLGLAAGANAEALLLDPTSAEDSRSQRRIYVPDIFIALTNGLRAGLAILLTAVIWIELAWQGGQGMMVFAAVITILFAPQADVARKVMPDFVLGVLIATALAAIVQFAVLPGQQTYPGLVLSIAVVMIPSAYMAAGNWHRSTFTAINFIFIAVLTPSNRESFNLTSFFNGALATVSGVTAGLLAFQLFPPVSPAWKARRLLALNLRDVRRFAAGRNLRSTHDWMGLAMSRISALPPVADQSDRARMVAGFSAGTLLLRLREQHGELIGPHRLRQAFDAFTDGRVAACSSILRALADDQPSDPRGLRNAVELVLLSDVLTRHERYFSGNTHSLSPNRA